MKKFSDLISENKRIWSNDEEKIFEIDLMETFKVMDNYLLNNISNLNDKKDQIYKLVKQILDIEWFFFKKANNIGGQADCQRDFETFRIMRGSQWISYPIYVLLHYLQDIEKYINDKRNIMTDKYAYMMEETNFEEYIKIRSQLPEITIKKRYLIEMNVGFYMYLSRKIQKKFPNVYRLGRNLSSEENTKYDTSIETYLRGELSTYSDETLSLLFYHFVRSYEKGENVVYDNLLNILKAYGYETFEEAEEKLKQN